AGQVVAPQPIVLVPASLPGKPPVPVAPPVPVGPPVPLAPPLPVAPPDAVAPPAAVPPPPPRAAAPPVPAPPVPVFPPAPMPPSQPTSANVDKATTETVWRSRRLMEHLRSGPISLILYPTPHIRQARSPTTLRKMSQTPHDWHGARRVASTGNFHRRSQGIPKICRR